MNILKPRPKSQLEEAIALAHQHLENETPGTKEYNDVVESLAALYKIKDPNPKSSVELRDWIPVIGVVLPVLIVLGFEAGSHTITSKAASFIPKPRI